MSTKVSAIFFWGVGGGGSVAFTKSVGMGWVFVVVVHPFSQGDIPNE